MFRPERRIMADDETLNACYKQLSKQKTQGRVMTPRVS